MTKYGEVERHKGKTEIWFVKGDAVVNRRIGS